MAVLTVISGPPGSGKSTACKDLARASARSLHLNADLLYNMVEGGYRQPWEEGAEELMAIMYQAAAAQTQIYLARGFDVFIDYVFEERDLEQFFGAFTDGSIATRLIFLLPTAETVVSRDGAREFVVGADRVQTYHERFTKLKQAWPDNYVDNSSERITALNIPAEVPLSRLLARLRATSPSR